MSFAPPRTSTILRDLASGPGGRIGVRDILQALRERAFALLVVLLGLPNCLPMPPPIPLLCGLLLGFVALQLIWGRKTPWLPGVLTAKSLSRDDVTRAAQRALPWLYRLERFARPRLAVFDGEVGMRGVGAVLLVFSLALLFSAPFVGQIPLGLAICLVGLGLVERDGIIVLVGIVIGAAGIALSLGFIFALFSAAMALAR